MDGFGNPRVVSFSHDRYQRRQALSIMKAVNEFYVLPNPLSWHETTTKHIKKAVTGFNRVFVTQKHEPVRVSRDDYDYAI